MKARVQKIFEHLRSPADVMLLVNSTEPHLDQSFVYVFDVPSGMFEGSCAVAFPDGRLTILSSLLEEESARQAAKRDPTVTIEVPTTRPERDQILSRLIRSDATVALNYRELTHDSFLSLEKALPKARWVDASDSIRSARMIKDAEEIARLRRAAEIASAVAVEIPSLLKAGMTELDLAAEMEYRMVRGGASGRSFSTITAFGAMGAEPHYAPQNRRLTPGTSIVCDFGALYQRYASDITRSFRFGPADAELKGVHEKVLEAQEAALSVIRPGLLAKDAHLAAQRVIDASPWKGRFIHGLGHSIGLAVHDGFGMNQLVDEPLEEGMAITVEPGIYLPGKGGVRIEDDIVVTRGGYEFLTTAPRGYIEVPA
ncbi:MAG: Xaa-Pro peptidase family protein [Thermoplasmata archaeon]|nr:Xaa-Pro peptidase family protein [Thermoplasmata archaeon]MCI4359431.1 Xaa-Pro peptidase family protein [Thermoplasmata archaeon]